MSDEKVVLFIDLLGTKDSSRISEEHFYHSVFQFLRALVEEGARTGESTNILYFSDSAFAELSADKACIDFLKRLRHTLFSQEIYFKCAVVRGHLKPTKIDSTRIMKLYENFVSKEDYERASEFLKQNNQRINHQFKGFFFGETSVNAYVLHERFKGIGFIFDQGLHDVFGEEFVQSIFFSSQKSRGIQQYQDLKYDTQSETYCDFDISEQDFSDLAGRRRESDEFLRILFKSMEKAFSRKKEFFRYYAPLIVALIRSTSFAKTTLSPDDENVIANLPLIFCLLVHEKYLERRRIRFTGIELIYFALADQVLKTVSPTEKGQEVRKILCREIGQIKDFRSRIQAADEMVIEPRRLHELIEIMTE